MNYWQATIRTWPYSTNAGQVEDKKAVGNEFETFEIHADGFDDAAAKAKLIVAGIKTNPRVWQSNLVKLAMVQP